MTEQPGKRQGDRRGSVISNCIGLIKLLSRRTGVSIEEIANELGMTTRNAYRYIESASLHLPVWETRSIPKRFKLLEESDYDE